MRCTGELEKMLDKIIEEVDDRAVAEAEVKGDNNRK